MKIWFLDIMRYYLMQSLKLYGLKYPLAKIPIYLYEFAIVAIGLLLKKVWN